MIQTLTVIAVLWLVVRYVRRLYTHNKRIEQRVQEIRSQYVTA